MAGTSITVLKARVLDGCFAPEKGAEPETLSWKEFLGRFCPANTVASPHKLLQITAGSYVGLSVGLETHKIVNFVMTNRDRSGYFGWITDKDPTFAGRIQTVYNVLSVVWASKIEESGAAPGDSNVA